MAVKEYGYYIKANKIKLIERDVNFDNDPNSRSYGPGVDRGEWKSPLSTVTDGLQLEYTYVPAYRINSIASADKETLVSYESTDGKLTLNGTGFSTESSIDYIVITGSDKWNGLHKVTAVNTAWYKLDTKYNGANVTESSVIYTDITALEDESFELDLPDYLGRAIEIYIRGRIFDEAGDFEKSMYYMKEFKKYMEKHDTSKQWGHRAVAAGPYAIR